MAIKFLNSVAVDTDVLFVDTANERVGIGTTSPAQLFEVNGGSGQLITTDSHQRLFITSSPLHQSILYFGDTNSNSQGRVAYDNNFDDMYFNTAAAERMRITSTGNVGIGTTSPSATLDVFGGGLGARIVSIQNTALEVQGGANAQDIARFKNTGGNVQFVINNGGDVGIGVASPSTKLEVAGNILANATNATVNIGSTISSTPAYGYPNTAAGSLVVGGYTNGGYFYQPGVITLINQNPGIVAGTDLGVIQFAGKDDATSGYVSTIIKAFTAAGTGTGNSGGGILTISTTSGYGTPTERFRINQNGNVGIGVTSPSARLDVSNAGLAAKFVSTQNTGLSVQGGANSQDLAIFKNPGGITELVVKSTGNVGIGNNFNTPSERLEVSGGNLKVSNTGTPTLILNSTNSTGAKIQALKNGSASPPMGQLSWDSNTGISLFFFSTSYQANSLKLDGSNFIVTNANSERMRINSSGNVGFGTTSPLGKLQVNEYTVASQGNQGVHGEVSIFANSGNESLFLGIRDAAYPNRGWAFNTITNGINSDLQIKEHGSTGVRMTIQTGGNVGIGTTSPSQKLHVDGNARVTGAYYDSGNTPGTVNQLLASTATGTAWIDPSTIVAEAATLVVIACKNTSGATIAQGTPVYQTGTVGATATIEIAPADALISANKLPAIGLLQTTLNNNGFGNVVITGELTNFTTDPIDGLTPTTGDKVFVKSGGGLTLTKPTGEGNGIQNMGLVGKVSGGNAGSITVSSIMRTNDVPNLPEGRIWVGDGNTIVSDTVYIDEPNLRLGIGTASPSKKLEVRSSNAYDSTIRLATSAHNWDIQGGEAGYSSTSFALDYDGATFFRAIGTTDARFGGGLSVGTINATPPTGGLYVAGNVGIGTTSPSTKLDVGGVTTSLGFRTEAANTNWSLISRDSAGNSPLYVQSANSNTGQWIARFNYGSATANGGDNVLTVAKDSSYFLNTNVGIGTTSPDAKLQVAGDFRLGDGVYTAIDFNADPSSHQGNGGLEIKPSTVPGSGTANWYTRFASNVATGTTNHNVTIDGNVGIGTTSPSRQLEVTNTGNAIIRIAGDSDNDVGETGDAVLEMTTDAGGQGWSIRSTNIGGGTGYFKVNTFINSVESTKLLIDRDGNVGIGTTSPSYKLQVAGGILAGGKVTYSKTAGSLDTTGYAVAGLIAGWNGNSCMFTFTAIGNAGHYQKVVYSCWNAAGTWNTSKVIDEGTNGLDIEASTNGTTVTFTFKSRSGSLNYSPRVVVEASGHSINNTYA